MILPVRHQAGTILERITLSNSGLGCVILNDVCWDLLRGIGLQVHAGEQLLNFAIQIVVEVFGLLECNR
jgi:hypothetical protein